MTKSRDELLSALLRDHEGLRGLFEDHQRSLLNKDIDNAVGIFTEFEEVLSRHIRFEETYLLPKYAQEGGETAGGTLAIFQAEHEKLLAVTSQLAHEILALYGGTDIDAQIIRLLDQETSLKGLLDHHAHREENILAPRLEERTTSAERADLLQQHKSLI